MSNKLLRAMRGRGGVLGRPDDVVVDNMSMKLELCNVERDENETKECDNWPYPSIYLALVLVLIPMFEFPVDFISEEKGAG